MRLSIVSLAILVLVERHSLVQAVNPILWRRFIDVSRSYRSEGHIEARVQQDAHSIMNQNLHHQRDIVASPAIVAPNVKSSAVSIAAAVDETGSWDTITQAACLAAFNDGTNTTQRPCGVAACYNIKYYDNTTGVFQAELRLYRTSPATGMWTSMKSDGVKVKVSCKGASMAAGTMQMGKRDNAILSWPQTQRLRIFRRLTPGPEMIQQMSFYGEIHEDLMGQIQTESSARSFLAPAIALSGTSADGTPLLADLSANVTSFVSGVFGPNQLAASAIPASEAEKLAEEGFVMPGRTLGIFPVGLVITSIWTALFLVTIGVGTVDRVRFREAYRRRMKRELSLGVRTI